MAFAVHLTFTGMQMFVPDFGAAGDGLLHVLVPSTLDTPHPHTVTLRYTGSSSGQKDLTDYELAFQDLDAGTQTEIVNVANLAQLGRWVDRALFAPQPGDGVAARVTVPAWAGMAPACSPTWVFPMLPWMVNLTNQITFDFVHTAGDTVTLRLSPVGGTPELLELGPDEEGALELTVANLPLREPPAPPVGQPAPHFSHLYALCNDPNDPGPSPVLARLAECGEMQGGSPYTCLGAQAPPGP